MTDTRFAFAQPLWLGEVASTNDTLKAMLASADKPSSGAVVAARVQTRGRGRMQNAWQSSPRGDLTFSLYWQGEAAPLEAGSLPMACALGVRDFLAADPWRVATKCKWPNDVLAGDAKICGILTEGGRVGETGFGLVVGIGVNLRVVPGRDQGLGRPTAALEDFAADVPEAETLLPSLLSRIERRIDQWQRNGYAGIRADLTACLWGIGREVTAKTARGAIRGTVTGLGDDGELIVRGSDGRETRVPSVTALEAGWDLG